MKEPVTNLLPEKKYFQHRINGKNTELYLLQNAKGIQAAVTNYGARWVSMIVPDQTGEPKDVVVGFATLKEYTNTTDPYYGATVGRFANRIAKGKFTLNGRSYSLATNNGTNHLHGGPKGFHAVVWEVVSASAQQVIMQHTSPDGEEGYPGNTTVQLRFTLQEDATLQLDFEAVTDQDTLLNVTNHAYFNLNSGGSILDHRLSIFASQYTPIDHTSIPLGTIDPVAGTPFDFLQPHTIGERINEQNIQLKNGSGYDHNFVLDKKEGFSHAATAIGDQSGITMDVFTEEPGLQFYSGNFMKGAHTMKGGFRDDFRCAFCLETQHFPDAPNQPAFPSVVLRPGEQYKSKTEFRFR